MFRQRSQSGRIRITIRGRHNTRRKISMDKVIITVVGKDTVGIIAKVCTYLADHKINILDISQTIVQEYFNMMMIVDGSGASVSFDEIFRSWRMRRCVWRSTWGIVRTMQTISIWPWRSGMKCRRSSACSQRECPGIFGRPT